MNKIACVITGKLQNIATAYVSGESTDSQTTSVTHTDTVTLSRSEYGEGVHRIER